MVDERPIDPDRIKADNERALNRIRVLMGIGESLPECNTDPPEDPRIADAGK
jgi:hypothetical protein